MLPRRPLSIPPGCVLPLVPRLRGRIERKGGKPQGRIAQLRTGYGAPFRPRFYWVSGGAGDVIQCQVAARGETGAVCPEIGPALVSSAHPLMLDPALHLPLADHAAAAVVAVVTAPSAEGVPSLLGRDA